MPILENGIRVEDVLCVENGIGRRCQPKKYFSSHRASALSANLISTLCQSHLMHMRHRCPRMRMSSSQRRTLTGCNCVMAAHACMHACMQDQIRYAVLDAWAAQAVFARWAASEVERMKPTRLSDSNFLCRPVFFFNHYAQLSSAHVCAACPQAGADR